MKRFIQDILRRGNAYHDWRAGRYCLYLRWDKYQNDFHVGLRYKPLFNCENFRIIGLDLWYLRIGFDIKRKEARDGR